MKSLKLLSILIFSIFLISFASAVDVDGQWEDGSQQPMIITKGDSVNFIAESSSKYSPSILNIKFYNSQDEEIYSFENNTPVGKNVFFSQQYEVNPSIYNDSENYYIEISASDNIPSSDRIVLDLTVEEVTPIDNNAPTVTITNPVDGATYTSAVNTLTYTATDAEGNLDKCWYSDGNFTSNPTTCSGTFTINSQEGQNTFTVYARDTYGNVGNDSVTFIVEIE